MRFRKHIFSFVVLLAVYLMGLFTPVIVRGALNPLGLLFSLHADRREITRLTSPDHVLDAVVVEINPGAFSSYLYEVHLVPKGGKTKTDPDYAIFRAIRADGLQVTWKRTHLLEITYNKAHIYHFRNLWYSKDVESGHYLAEVRLVPLSPEFSYLKSDGTV
jgi:hypothetical protein